MGDQEGEGSALTEEQVRRVVETAINPFCVIDLAGDVLWAGASMEELLGWRAAEMVGRSMIDFVAPASVAYAIESLATAADYVSSRRDEPSTWEGVGPVVGLDRFNFFPGLVLVFFSRIIRAQAARTASPQPETNEGEAETD